MLLPSRFILYRFVAVFVLFSLGFLTSWSLLPPQSWTHAFHRLKPQKTPSTVLLPSIYEHTVTASNDCTKRVGSLFLQKASNTTVNYCSDDSPSQLLCFRTDASNKHVDSFCIGTAATFDGAQAKFKLGCALTDLNEEQAASGVPQLAQFPTYWYQTGPRTILNNHVQLNSAEVSHSRKATLPKDYVLLVRREAPVDNVFHHFMQLFSIFMTLDVLQMVLDPMTGRPLFRAEDAERTRVVIFDDHEDGPFYDQWTAFSQGPVKRIKDLGDPPSPLPANIILPLPGSANPLWQDDWEPEECGESNLLQLFSQRMLNFYKIKDGPRDLDGPLALTFIDRTEKRSLVDKKAYIDHIRALYPDVDISLVNFASLSFADQIRTIRRTDILAGIHGAGLTHGIFLQPSSTVVEILPYDFSYKGFRNIANILGHQYFASHASENATYTNKGWQYDDVFIEQDRFNDLIDSAIRSAKNRRAAQS